MSWRANLSTLAVSCRHLIKRSLQLIFLHDSLERLIRVLNPVIELAMRIGKLTHNSVVTLRHKSLEKGNYQLNFLTHMIFVRSHTTSPNLQTHEVIQFRCITRINRMATI
jgi:low affinity Fe/Cu permease